MIFKPAPLDGAYVIELERLSDERGWFARSYDDEAFRDRGLNPTIRQCNVSFNAHAGTLRGMHYQDEPYAEAKLVRCTRGTICDVIVDLRKASPTFRHWYAVELSPDNGLMLFVPEGVAHGFQTLTDDTEVTYQMSKVYSPEHARGVRWNDVAFGIKWPRDPVAMSERDCGYPDFHA